MLFNCGYKRTAVLLAMILSFCPMLPVSRHQAIYRAEDLIQSENRQERLRQIMRLAMQMEFEQANSLIVGLRTAAEQKRDNASRAVALMAETAVLALQYKHAGSSGELSQNSSAGRNRIRPARPGLRAELACVRQLLPRRLVKQANEDAKRSLSLNDSTTDKPEIAFTLSILGLAQSDARQLDEAEAAFRQSLAHEIGTL